MDEEKPAPRRLVEFEIVGLHGDKNVRLELGDQVKILIDSNGSGKTTVLNALYYILADRLYGLARLSFESVSLTFDNGRQIRISASDIKAIAPGSEIGSEMAFLAGSERWIARMRSILSPPEYDNIINMARRSPSRQTLARHSLVIHVARSLGVPPDALSTAVMQWARGRHNLALNETLADPLAELKKLFPYQVIYFPTYRRVEEELHTLGYREPELPHDERLIQFGMDDVKQRLDRITSQIRDSSVEWYSKVNGRILTELIDGIQVTPEMRDGLQDAATLRIVLDRVGENIDEQHKEHILELIREEKIADDRYSPLVYFLSNLAKVYEQQREKDNLIKEFVRVANYYLDDKEVVYNESKLQIRIVHKRSGRLVDLERLSSGEKQIVSIFSRVYLAPRREYVVLFDEPELSLSIEWQKRLLEDIRSSNRCKLLIAATHSPFIFENTLDRFAGELSITDAHTDGPCEPDTLEGDLGREDPEE